MPHSGCRINNGTAKFTGKVWEDGDIWTGSVVFDQIDDGTFVYFAYSNVWYGGHYCPNSGVATLSFSLEVMVTKYNGGSLTKPCLVSLGRVDATTETSGGVTGVRFTNPSPKMVGVSEVFTVPHGPIIGGLPTQYCDGEFQNVNPWLAIRNTFTGTSNSTGKITLTNMNFDPHPYGDGC